MQPWLAVVDDSRARELLSVVIEIGNAVPEWIAAHESCSAAERAEAALFLAYAAEATNRDELAERAVALLEQAIGAVAAAPIGSALHGGVAGVGWVIEHLRGWLFDSDEDPNAPLDRVLAQVLEQDQRGAFDIVAGAAGIAVYALERAAAGADPSLLQRALERLDDLAEQNAGVSWFSRPELLPGWQRQGDTTDGYHDLGAAHGVAGVIAVLADIVATLPEVGGPRRLLDGAVPWLLGRRRPDDGGSRFGAWAVPGQTTRSCRSAWCYGDPGVAMALLAAGRATGSRQWEAEGLALARQAAARPPADAGVVDAGLCHGAAGLAHLLNRSYQATGEEELAEAARFWYGRVLALRQPARGVAGFASYVSGKWMDDGGFLTGASGVGLALLAGATEIEPAWDRLLGARLQVGNDQRAAPARTDA